MKKIDVLLKLLPFAMLMGETYSAEYIGLRSDAKYTEISDEEFDFLEWWETTVQNGEKAIIVEVNQETETEGGINFWCLAKANDTNAILDPPVQSNAHLGTFVQNSYAGCRVGEEFGFQTSAAENVNTTSNVCQDTSMISSDCKYPGDEFGQENWGGLSFKVSMVNGHHTTESYFGSGVAYEDPWNTIYNGFNQSAVYGTDYTVTKVNNEEGHTYYYYTGGAVFSTQTLDNMFYSIYIFSSEEERQAALNDPRNEGLEYSKTMKGENGCDAEILYKLKPKSGGGLEICGSQLMETTSLKIKRRLLDHSSAYITPEEHTATFQVNSSVLRESQYLSFREGCDDGNTITAKFSTQFICKTTGKAVNASSIKYHNALDHRLEVSTDPNNATPFQPDPSNPSDCYYSQNCPGITWTWDPDFDIVVNVSDAPESCEWMYWDPLVIPAKGDGTDFEIREIRENDEFSEFEWLLYVCILLIIVGIVFIHRKCCVKKIEKDTVEKEETSQRSAVEVSDARQLKVHRENVENI